MNRKRITGVALILLGLILVGIFIWRGVSHEQEILSPIPNERGVKVIYLTPTP